MSSFCICKSYSRFYSKITCEFDIVLTVDILTTNELVKLTLLWKLSPVYPTAFSDCKLTIKALIRLCRCIDWPLLLTFAIKTHYTWPVLYVCSVTLLSGRKDCSPVQQTTNWWSIFFIFPRKEDLAFHANCLQWKQDLAFHANCLQWKQDWHFQ